MSRFYLFFVLFLFAFPSIAQVDWAMTFYHAGTQGTCMSWANNVNNTPTGYAYCWANNSDPPYWYGAYMPLSGEPCDTGSSWDAQSMSCNVSDDCPTGNTTIGGDCLPDQWCPTLGGYISSNLTCPEDSPQDNENCDDCGPDFYDLTSAGDDAGSDAGNDVGNDVADDGGTRDDAGSQGGSQGAGAGVDAARDAGAGGSANGGTGLTDAQASALSGIAEQAGAANGATADSVSNTVISSCMELVGDPQACGELGIAAGSGFTAGRDNAVNAYDDAVNGPNLSYDLTCELGDCTWQVFSCDPPRVWNGSSTTPRCIMPDLTLECVPTVYNDFCNEGTVCRQQGGVWNSLQERCETRIAMNECPPGTVMDTNRQCVSRNSTEIDSNAPINQCPAGYVYDGLTCRLRFDSSTVTRNSDGTTTTSYTYNNDNSTNNTNNSNSGTGVTTGTEQLIGAGDCDPTAEDYAECVGQVQIVPDDFGDDIIDGANTSAQSAIDGYESQMLDFVHDGNSLAADPSMLKSFIDTLLPSYVPCSLTQFNLGKFVLHISCEKINEFKTIFGWFLYLSTLIYLFHLAITPIESRV